MPGPPGTTDFNSLENKPDLGTAAAEDVEAFATAAQGTKADEALPATSLPSIATQAQAEAGTITTPRLFSPATIAAAIAAQSSGGIGGTIEYRSLAGVGAFDLALPVGFLRYQIELDLSFTTNFSDLLLQGSTDGGSSYASNNFNYAQDVGGGGFVGIVTPASGDNLSVTIDVIGARNAATFTTFRSVGAQASDDSLQVVGTFKLPGIVDALRFTPTQGGAMSGSLYVTGLKEFT